MAMDYLRYDELIDLHREILEAEEHTHFDENRVKSIMGCIEGGAFGQLYHPTVIEVAAAYLFYFARNQAFAQGNKRTAVLACDTFLDMNELPLQGEIDPDFVKQIGTGAIEKQGVLEYLRTLVVPVQTNISQE